jgi:hypothetical protein
MPSDQFRIEFVDGLLGLSRLKYIRLAHGLSGTPESRIKFMLEDTKRLWAGDLRGAANDTFVEMTDLGERAIGEPGESRHSSS